MSAKYCSYSRSDYAASRFQTDAASCSNYATPTSRHVLVPLYSQKGHGHKHFRYNLQRPIHKKYCESCFLGFLLLKRQRNLFYLTRPALMHSYISCLCARVSIHLSSYAIIPLIHERTLIVLCAIRWLLTLKPPGRSHSLKTSSHFSCRPRLFYNSYCHRSFQSSIKSLYMCILVRHKSCPTGITANSKSNSACPWPFLLFLPFPPLSWQVWPLSSVSG